MNNEQFRRLLLDHHQPNKTHQQSNSSIQRGARDKDAQNSTPSTLSPSSASASASASTNLLGSRMRSSIPMTPRHVRGNTAYNNRNEFARQLAEQQQFQHHQPPAKRFKASAAPKGTKYSGEYQDRTALRRQQTQTQMQTQTQDEYGTSDKSGGNQGQRNVEQRLQALEEMVKLGQIDRPTFDRLRKEIGVGGDLKSTHLVKGLDWDLLKRAKAGEDLSLVEEQQQEEEKGEVVEQDVDDELNRVLDETETKGFVPVPKEAKVKKGNLATTSARSSSLLSSSSSGKLSRDEILKQLKASRAATILQSTAAAPPAESTLGAKFKKIDKSDKKRWIETDPATGRRKEILVITDAEGNSKRKTRWLDKEPAQSMMKATTTNHPKVNKHGLLLPGQNSQPLGMEVPAVVAARIAAEKAAEAEAEDDDIFVGVGTDYNPLGDLEEDEDDDDDEEAEEEEETGDKSNLPKVNVTEDKTVDGAVTNEQSAIQQQRSQRDYFQTGTKKDDEHETSSRTNILANDPTLLAALKRAAALRQKSAARERCDDDDEEEEEEEEEGEESLLADTDDPERMARRKKFLEEVRRRDALDALDLDYGFGSSRIEDEEDEEGPTFGDGDGLQRGINKRKRGPKKRKGDKDSATDVLRVMEGRKKS